MGIYVISNCLLGNNCKYNGGNNYNEKIIKFLKDKEYIAICPEVSGGMSTPRKPSEIISTSPLKLINSIREDVTHYFITGASLEYDKIKKEKIICAILKEKSPSCGSSLVYDGNFNGTLIKGDGVFASLLKENGIKVYTESEFIKEMKL